MYEHGFYGTKGLSSTKEDTSILTLSYRLAIRKGFDRITATVASWVGCSSVVKAGMLSMSACEDVARQSAPPNGLQGSRKATNL